MSPLGIMLIAKQIHMMDIPKRDKQIITRCIFRQASKRKKTDLAERFLLCKKYYFGSKNGEIKGSVSKR